MESKHIKEKARPTRRQRGYDYSWKKLSKQLREQQPFCSIAGCTNKDLTVDHIIPLSEAPYLRLEITNLKVLCRKHNSSKGNS